MKRKLGFALILIAVSASVESAVAQVKICYVPGYWYCTEYGYLCYRGLSGCQVQGWCVQET